MSKLTWYAFYDGNGKWTTYGNVFMLVEVPNDMLLNLERKELPKLVEEWEWFEHRTKTYGHGSNDGSWSYWKNHQYQDKLSKKEIVTLLRSKLKRLRDSMEFDSKMESLLNE